MNRFYEILKNLSEAAQKTYDGKKRSDLKDSDFLFPATKSFPIVIPQDVKDAINNFGRMNDTMNYETFLRKLYNMCKRKGPEFVAALPEASKEKLDIKKSKADDESPEVELMEYKQDFYEMSVGSIQSIMDNSRKILENLDNPSVRENLTESWLQGKIAITEDYMRTIHDFVMYVTESDDETSEGGSKPGLWENIRKKKEREGKNYKPAKPGDKDRPNPETWKKLTKDSKKSR